MVFGIETKIFDKILSMNDPFFLKLFLSFIIGGVWVILVTVSADKLGSKIGGLISGLPSTLLFGLFFIGWAQSPQIAAKATTIVPLLNGISALYLCSFIYFIRKNNIWITLTVSLLIWLLLSLIVILLKIDNILVSLTGYLILLAFSFYLLKYKLKVKSVQGKKIKYSLSVIIFRGLLSGSVVAISVFLAKVGGPILGGAASMFPAIFTSTLLISYFSQGSLFSIAIAKTIMIGSVSLVVHALAIRFSYPILGIVTGTIISTLVSFVSGLVIYRFIIKKTA